MGNLAKSMGPTANHTLFINYEPHAVKGHNPISQKKKDRWGGNPPNTTNISIIGCVGGQLRHPKYLAAHQPLRFFKNIFIFCHHYHTHLYRFFFFLNLNFIPINII